MRFADSAALWNAAEPAEKREDAQVAREIVLALPVNAARSDDDRIALARSFAEQHLVAIGRAAPVDPHRPHEGEGEPEQANWHTQLLITTRGLEGEAFAAMKAKDLNPEVRRPGGPTSVADGEAWDELWRAHRSRYFVGHWL